MDPAKTAVENAEAYFARAKKAKRSAEGVKALIERLLADLTSLREAIAALDAAEDEQAVRDVEGLARVRQWLVEQRPVQAREERPF